MLAILTILFLVSFAEPSEQRPNRRPQQEPEISLIPCKNCRHTDNSKERTRTYRSSTLSDTSSTVEDSYKQEFDVKEQTIPMSHETIVLGEPEIFMKVA